MEDLLSTPAAPATDAGTGATSAVSWPAILAGAFVAMGASVILLTLGSGLGFAAASPWPYRGASASELTVAGAIWLIVTQWVSAALGGYIAGRLRRRWVGTHVHEVFFRDTAHGLVTWAVATVAVAALLGGSASSLLGRGAQDAAAGALRGATQESTTGMKPGNEAQQGEPYGQMKGNGGATTDSVPDSATAEESADAVRKAAAQAALYTALSLLVGAFVASVSAALGGRLRDEHV